LMLATTIVVAPVRAQSGADLVEACKTAGGSQQLCLGIEHIIEIPARICRNAGGGDACDSIDGRQINKYLVDAHERSWLARALGLQHSLSDDLPIHQAFWAYSHNSFNNEALSPTLAGIDPNQTYSIADQLRMGIRTLELDVHWAPHPLGDPLNGFNAVVLCHGEPIPIGFITYHLGCTVDRLLRDGLEEIRAWLDANPDELIMIFLENTLDDNPIAHERAAADLAEVLGDITYKATPPCSSLPMQVSRNEIRSSGGRVLLTGNCGPGAAWGSLVFERGPLWDESGIEYGDDFPAYPCAGERAEHDYEENLIRRHADETGLSLALGEGGDVTVADAFNMARCGVDMLGMDHVVPFDPRMFAEVWSWAVDQPNLGSCAYQGGDGRFYSDDCLEVRPFVCHTTEGAWITSERTGAWGEGPAACSDVAAEFAVPRNGYDNERLKNTKGSGEAWLNYSELPDAGWAPDTA
jgi:hypothetical protein